MKKNGCGNGGCNGCEKHRKKLAKEKDKELKAKEKGDV